MSNDQIDGQEEEILINPELKAWTWLAIKGWDTCPVQGPIDLVWMAVAKGKCVVGQYFSDLKLLSLEKAWWLDSNGAKNLSLIIEGLDRGESSGDLLPDPFEPPSVDLDDIFDDDELEGLVACSKDGEICESCQ